MSKEQSLSVRSLLQAYRRGATTPEETISLVYQRIEEYADPAIWIYLAPLEESLKRAKALENSPDSLPLYGIPFAIKDNIDWAGVPTTAACPEFAYIPDRSATVVEKLIKAGAIPIGKTNMDQFATGLLGTRSPYGVCRNPFNERYIPGGSSSGSGACVSAGLVSFALGTDTAGSGRVPAAFTNIVGLKPTKGYLSTTGVVPAVRSLDCVSIFALTCGDGDTVLEVVSGFDSEDPFSRSPLTIAPRPLQGLRVGIPSQAQLQFFGNTEAEKNYQKAITRLEAMGCLIGTINFQPFTDAAMLLYEGAWIAERAAAVGEFLEQDYPGVNPIVRQIIMAGKKIDGITVYKDLYKLMELKRQAEQHWQNIDILALPTTGTIYTLAEVEAEPLTLNRNLGTYTNFVNLLDLSAIAVPSGFQSNGLPTGITFMAPAWYDRFLCTFGSLYHTQLGGTLGFTGLSLPVIT